MAPANTIQEPAVDATAATDATDAQAAASFGLSLEEELLPHNAGGAAFSVLSPEEELAELACRNAQLEELLRESHRISDEFKALSVSLDKELEDQKADLAGLREENRALHEANVELQGHLHSYYEENEALKKRDSVLQAIQERLDQLDEPGSLLSVTCCRSRRASGK